MTHRGRSAADSRLIAALAGGATQADAAAQAGVSISTVRRRMGDPAFLADLDSARRLLVDAAIGRLSSKASDAVDTLHRLLNARSENVRLGAARAILDTIRQHRESIEIEQRLRELEAMASEIEARR